MARRAAGGVKVVASEFGSNFIPLGVGKSVVVDLARDAKDVLVADPKIANAVVRTARRAYLIGTGIGQTNIYFFDAEGRQLAGFDSAVTRDLNGMRGLLRQMFPEGNV
jgi:pilus assembly protein CpaC